MMRWILQLLSALQIVHLLPTLIRTSVANEVAPRFYIYDWPSELDDVWPPDGNPIHSTSGYVHQFRENNGAGRQLNAAVGLYQTWQFSLYKQLISRLRVSEYRTLNPEEATAFVIPFDLGVHSYIDHLDGRPRLAAPHGRQAQALLKEKCNGKFSEIFWKYRGHDHFLIMSITAYQMVGMQVKYFYMFVCQNCTTITIETSPTKTAIPGRTRKYWYAVPYPSSFHWHEGIEQVPWALPGKGGAGGGGGGGAGGGAGGGRDIVALFIGSAKPSQPTSRYLRKVLQTQCVADKGCQWHETPHTCNGVVNSSATMLLLRRSQYCPAPAGDSITRKSIFDALVAGCVPVLFSRATLSQYSWHLTDKQVDQVSVYIPMTSINDNHTDFMQVLRRIPLSELRKKQRAIAVIAPTLQYSVIPDRVNVSVPGTVWKPPFRDAVEIIVERILDRQTVEPIGGFSNEELMQQHMQQQEIMKVHEDFAALRPRGSLIATPRTITLADVDPAKANEHPSISFVVNHCKPSPANWAHRNITVEKIGKINVDYYLYRKTAIHHGGRETTERRRLRGNRNIE